MTSKCPEVRQSTYSILNFPQVAPRTSIKGRGNHGEQERKETRCEEKGYGITVGRRGRDNIGKDRGGKEEEDKEETLRAITSHFETHGFASVPAWIYNRMYGYGFTPSNADLCSN
jgi:hypothetical protein